MDVWLGLFVEAIQSATPVSLATLVLAALAVALLAALYRRDVRSPLESLGSRFANVAEAQERTERALRQEISTNRREMGQSAQQAREEAGKSMHDFRQSIMSTLSEVSKLQNEHLASFAEQLVALTGSNEKRLETLRQSMERHLKSLQEDNTKKLDEMRRTVDEKLQGTLERRLGESFKHVSDRLEQVHKGLGEMQTLATGVGDLKRVLTNVKVRGTWGEIQLESLLEQVLTPAQYDKNVATKPGSAERVEFCIKLPGRTEDPTESVWLPIDAKFPQEDYRRLLDAQDGAEVDAVAAAGKQLETRVKSCAKDIHDKYISPPDTTDFAIMFLPNEGLYAEVVRRPALLESLQREYRVVVAGPTTLGALLNSLQMGFRTLAIEQRSSEVWKTLSTVKAEFGKFGGIIERVQRKLRLASDEMDRAASKTRTIERKLRKVEELPSSDARTLLSSESLALDLTDDVDTEAADAEIETAPNADA